MGIDCGSQIVLCDYPIRFDTYRGCSHGCKYCFAQKKTNIEDVRLQNCVQQLKNFIAGKRSIVTNWCDWQIPLHWGGMSDPFQPLESRGGVSMQCLDVFVESGYPVIISTKGKLLTAKPYLEKLKKCNAVVQVSMVCASYDKLEPGAPTFTERLGMLEALKGNCKRVIVRAQPYLTEVRAEFISIIESIKAAGADGITIEGMKFAKKKPGLVKVGGDWCYPEKTLKSHYLAIREECHRVGLAFYCAENRLRNLGDSMACCGCGEVDGFAGNTFHAVRLNEHCATSPTQCMQQLGTAAVFKSLDQSPGTYSKIKRTSMVEMMIQAAAKLGNQA
jgi:DNA repair photolyase